MKRLSQRTKEFGLIFGVILGTSVLSLSDASAQKLPNAGYGGGAATRGVYNSMPPRNQEGAEDVYLQPMTAPGADEKCDSAYSRDGNSRILVRTKRVNSIQTCDTMMKSPLGEFSFAGSGISGECISQQLAAGDGGRFAYAYAHPSEAGKVYVSDDGGANFVTINLPASPNYMVHFWFSSNHNLQYGPDGKLYVLYYSLNFGGPGIQDDVGQVNLVVVDGTTLQTHVVLSTFSASFNNCADLSSCWVDGAVTNNRVWFTYYPGSTWTGLIADNFPVEMEMPNYYSLVAGGDPRPAGEGGDGKVGWLGEDPFGGVGDNSAGDRIFIAGDGGDLLHILRKTGTDGWGVSKIPIRADGHLPDTNQNPFIGPIDPLLNLNRPNLVVGPDFIPTSTFDGMTLSDPSGTMPDGIVDMAVNVGWPYTGVVVGYWTWDADLGKVSTKTQRYHRFEYAAGEAGRDFTLEDIRYEDRPAGYEMEMVSDPRYSSTEHGVYKTTCQSFYDPSRSSGENDFSNFIIDLSN